MLLVIAAAFTACTTEFQPKGIKHVVVIGIDGMSVGGVMEANTPNFDEYMKKGAWSFNTRNVMPTSSGPCWSAMLTASGITQTGITSNDWRSDNYSLPPVVTTEYGRYPDIFYAIKKTNKELKTASVYHWGGFAHLYDHTSVDIDMHTHNERNTGKKAAEVIVKEKPNFLFIQIDHVDGVGHSAGHMTPKYFESITLADSLTAQIVDATKEAGIYDETVFMIVADHGGIGYGHGHETVQGNEVPFIIFGAGIKKDYKIPTAVNLHTIAATSAYALNVTTPQVWMGRPVECAFEGASEPDQSTLMGEFLAPSTYVPIILPRKPNGESGGLFVNKKAMVTIETKGNDGKIRYTTDGSIPTAKSTEYTGPFEMKESGIVKAAYFGNSGGQSAISEGYFRVAGNVSANTGIKYSLYKGKDWDKLPDFTTLSSEEEGRVYEISTDELVEKIEDYTAVVYEGYINIETNGKYAFTTRSDDGSKLYINNKLVVNNDGDHGVQEREGSIDLKAGKNKIRVEYFNGGGGFYLSATYRSPELAKQIISPEILSLK